MKLKSDNGLSRRKFVTKLMGGIAGSALGLSALEESLASSSPPLPLPKPNGSLDENFWKMVKNQFVIRSEKIYMNTSGLGPSPRVVIDTLVKTTLDLEEEAEHGHHLVHEVNEKAAKFLGCDTEEMAITRNTTEGMNIIARGLPLKKGDEILTTTHEHPGGAVPWLGLANDIGVKVKVFEPGKTKQEMIDRVKKNITKKTKVLSVCHIPCTIGHIYPVKELAEICRNENIYYVLDGAHPPGMIPFSLHETGADFYATSGHKWLLGPKGTGLLYIRKEMFEHWRPTFVGAYSEKKYDFEDLVFEHKHQANGTEYGTRNTPIALGLGAAINFIDTIGIENVAARGKSMADYFLAELLKMPELLEVLTPLEEESRASVITFKPKNMPHNELQKKIAEEANIRLRGIHENNLNAIRCSFHVFNTFEEVDKLLFTIKKILSA